MGNKCCCCCQKKQEQKKQQIKHLDYDELKRKYSKVIVDYIIQENIQEIDKALKEGFRPDLPFDIGGTDSNLMILSILGPNKDSALQSAVSSGNTEIVKLIIQKGAKKDLKGKNGYTPLDLAIKSLKQKQEIGDFDSEQQMPSHPGSVEYVQQVEPLRIKLMHKGKGNQYSKILIQLLTEKDMFFNFNFECEENFFKKIKNDNQLNIHYDQFSDSLQSMLNNCQKQPQQFNLIFQMNEEGKGELIIDQNTEYKTLRLIDLPFYAATSEQVKQNIMFRYNCLQGRMLNTKDGVDYQINISFYPSYEIDLEENEGIEFVKQGKLYEQEIFVVKNGQTQYPFRKEDITSEEENDSLVSHIQKFCKISQFRIWANDKETGEELKFDQNFNIQFEPLDHKDSQDLSNIIELYELQDYYNYQHNEEKEKAQQEQHFYVFWDHIQKDSISEEDIYKISIQNEDVEFYVKKNFQQEKYHQYFEIQIMDGDQKKVVSRQPFQDIDQPYVLQGQKLKLNFLTNQGSLIIQNFVSFENDEEIELDDFVINQFNYKQLTYDLECNEIIKNNDGYFSLIITGDVIGYDSFNLKFEKFCEEEIKFQEQDKINDGQQEIIEANDKLDSSKNEEKDQQQQITENEQKNKQTEINELNQDQINADKDNKLAYVSIVQPVYTDKDGFQIKAKIDENIEYVYKGNQVQSKFLVTNKSQVQMTYQENIDIVNFFIRNQNPQKLPVYISDPIVKFYESAYDQEKQEIITKPEVHVYSQMTARKHQELQPEQNIYQINYFDDSPGRPNRRKRNKIQIDFNCLKSGTQTLLISLPIIIDDQLEYVEWKINKICSSSSIDLSHHIEGSQSYLNIAIYFFYAVVIYIAYKIIRKVKKMISRESQEFQSNGNSKKEKHFQMAETKDLEEQSKLTQE
ncbi:Ankyrin repeat-containing domain [Pseudocohnilembus persalinus]|uniref:Ankyrin repeat-containing domain n=1 Tax=Pseudocohnilembus persalinus TaxID=266149 RepID=A0A0V0QG24_PSEPJ|nr:Ankyrin repeat-containing domain [Pseudocohnilembus persalinus]|eukprot:KRX01156.1 Ankyrin repeat-containing domain [Pseudocohnilembus persalinus]